jgi:ureidoglycolate hydrolase
MGEVVTVEAQPLTAEAWSPFGWLPVPDTDRRDAEHRLAFEWADAHLNFIAHSPDEIERVPEGFVVDRMFRHDSHTQALMPLDGEAVMVVAPASTDFSSPGHVEALRAFRLHPLDVLVLHQGTWHWGPFPTGPAPLRLLNVQGRRYLEDNASAVPGTAVVVRVP